MSEGPSRPLDGSDVGVERATASAVMRNRSFRNLIWASATSSIGDWIGLFGLIGLAATLEGAGRSGALAVSFVMIARIVPTLFFAPLAGVFVDRWDRKRTMIITDVVRGVVMLGIAFVSDAIGLVLATFVIELAAALFIPAKDATVPTIVRRDRLVQANQLSLVSTYATLPLGALLCAVVISITERVAQLEGMIARFPDAAAFLAERPEAVPIILNAMSFFGSIWFVRRMDIPDEHVQAYEQRQEQPNALRELRDGLEFIAGMPIIRVLVVGIMAAFLAAGVVIGVGEFFATILNASDAGFATLGFVVGTGLVVGIVGSGPLSARIRKEQLFAPGILVAGVMLVVAALMPTLLLAAVPAFIMGAGAGIAFILGYTMLQEYSEDAVRGRIFATFNTAVRMSLFAALVIGPLTITVLGVERTNAQIRAGEEVEIDDLEEGVEGRYPYQVGGVRLTLIASGLIAIAGAVWTGQSIARVLRRREDGEPVVTGDLGVGRAPDVDEPEPVFEGLFIAFEGGEGAGKSTQVALLRAAVERLGHRVVVTREPGGTTLGEALRELVLDADGEVAPRTEALLYAAARAQHSEDLLRPSLAEGCVVICDRYIDSSIAYQGVGRELGTGIIDDLNRWATDELLPDLTILLDVPAEEGLRRARDVDTPDRLEGAGARFHELVNEAFRHRARREPERYLVLDATRPTDELQDEIRAAVTSLLPGIGHEPPSKAEALWPEQQFQTVAAAGIAEQAEVDADAAAREAHPVEAGDREPDLVDADQVEADGGEADLADANGGEADPVEADPVEVPAADGTGGDPAGGDDDDRVPAWLSLPGEDEES